MCCGQVLQSARNAKTEGTESVFYKDMRVLKIRKDRVSSVRILLLLRLGAK